MTALLELRNVRKVFGGGLFSRGQTIAVDGLTFSVAEGPPSITAIVGESGSGKTTMARLLLGLVAPTSGEVCYRGQNLRKLSGGDRRQFLRDVQVIFQDPYEVYNPFYKVDHVLETPIRQMGLASSREEEREQIVTALRAVGLRPDETLGRFPHQLSGGQRQRVMVARALLLKPRVIIADEPVSMVDASLRATILESLRALNREFGISLIYITHDLTTAYQVAENIIVLYRGTVAEAGDVERVVKDPRHPYTQLLIGSIPLPNPDRPWHNEEREGSTDIDIHRGCPFANRCPRVMERCRERPPLYRVDENRAASCFVYADRPVLAADHLDETFVGHASAR